MRQEFFHVLDFTELDDLINKDLLKSNGSFESIPCFEWNDNCCYKAERVGKNEKYYKDAVDELVINGEYVGFNLFDILCYLCEKDIIPEGNYIIVVNW